MYFVSCSFYCLLERLSVHSTTTFLFSVRGHVTGRPTVRPRQLFFTDMSERLKGRFWASSSSESANAQTQSVSDSTDSEEVDTEAELTNVVPEPPFLQPWFRVDGTANDHVDCFRCHLQHLNLGQKKKNQKAQVPPGENTFGRYGREYYTYHLDVCGRKKCKSWHPERREQGIRLPSDFCKWIRSWWTRKGNDEGLDWLKQEFPINFAVFELLELLGSFCEAFWIAENQSSGTVYIENSVLEVMDDELAEQINLKQSCIQFTDFANVLKHSDMFFLKDFSMRRKGSWSPRRAKGHGDREQEKIDDPLKMLVLRLSSWNDMCAVCDFLLQLVLRAQLQNGVIVEVRTAQKYIKHGYASRYTSRMSRVGAEGVNVE